MRSVEITISGKVTGVNFRSWVANQANALGIGGWVRNNSDQTVTIHAEGEEDAVQKLINQLQPGPEGAEVTGVNVSEVDPENLSFFTVEY